ncbi:MAG: hypothetical protein JWN38_1026 [Candidatus Saccharibacteria bacterium]|nr:hypothetical protein [Candidatus Saccharibacteria bacterium]
MKLFSNSNKSKRLNQRGDTIIEVLVALTVLASALATAYVTSNKSLQMARDSQEHSEALLILQSQVEQARTIFSAQTSDATNPLTTSTKLYCVDMTQPATPTIASFTGSYNASGSTLLPLLTDDFNHYPTNCRKNSQAFSYNVSIQNQHTGAPNIIGNTLVFTARWDKLGGGRDQVSLTYRGYPGK